MNGTVTIDLFNRLTGQETLHPLVGLADLSGDALNDDVCMPCDFYALICKRTEADSSVSLRMVKPGEMFEIPSVQHSLAKSYTGVLFHPDLLCDTPLEGCIGRYPTRCCCHSAWDGREQQIITDCLKEIDKELHHAIDRHTSTIIVSHIVLLLNYCTRFCSSTK